jgi:hypothetical protein
VGCDLELAFFEWGQRQLMGSIWLHSPRYYFGDGTSIGLTSTMATPSLRSIPIF